jgi:hypothetical protein
MFTLRGVPAAPRVVVPSDRVPPSERFKVADAAMDAERWMERDLAAGAQALRYLDRDDRLHKRKARGKTRTLFQAPKRLAERQLVRFAPGIWGS